MHGGDGGTVLTLECPARQPVAMQIELYTALSTPVIVTGMFMFCGTLKSPRTMQRLGFWVGVEKSVVAQPMQRQSMTRPVGMTGVGLHGRHGKWVDSLGLICRSTA